MKVLVEGKFSIIDDTLVLSDDAVVVGVKDLVNYVPGSAPQSAPAANESNATEYDTTNYLNGNNGLTLAESAEEAFYKVRNMLDGYGWEIGDETDFLVSAEQLIRRAENGRQAVYILTGGIINAYKANYYRGIPFSYIFKGFVDGKLEEGSLAPLNPNAGSYALRRG